MSLSVSQAAYPLLGELTGTLVLAVSEQFDNSALVGGEAGDAKLACCNVFKQIFQILSMERRNNATVPSSRFWTAPSTDRSVDPSSRMRHPPDPNSALKKISTYPATSLTTSRTKAVRLLR